MQPKYYWIGPVALVFLCSCASQQDIYTLDHRIAALERHNLTLEQQIKTKDETLVGDENDIRGQYAGLAAQLQSYQDQAQLLSGRLDAVEHQLQQNPGSAVGNAATNPDRIDQMSTDLFELQKRMNAIEQYLAQNGKTVPAPTPAATPAPVPVKPEPVKPVPPAASSQPETDAELYVAAKREFDQGNMTAARNGFAKLLKAYPKSQQADNAQFWIAETYYREKWYEKAILEYQKVIENYAKGNKVPAAMLKQAYAFVNIGEANNARLILKEIIANYPGTSEAESAKKKLDAM
ncbi:conserved hypothetical protein [Desulfosarcina cetonica]|uniref:tol-pal system protein YbgF n=1 Tax=Desulfosarcina cetonica TaxID=90730 RepID=UPI0006D1F943|nr:tol-pal system protein YbgF [Desulfosarcina cetonica]VTR66149.1 conserved hypothetical protein [Desulfosarcina cetonica]